LPPEIAQTIWLFINVGLLVACAWLAARLCAPTARWWIWAAFPLLAPIGETLRYGQVYFLLAFFSLIAFGALRQRRDIPAGIAVAGMVLIKPYYGLLSLGVLAWSRRPRAVVAAMLAVIVVVIGSLPLLADAWPGFLPALLNVNNEPWSGIAAHQTLNSLTQHLFVYRVMWNPEPLMDAPMIAAGLRYGLSIVCVALTLRQATKHDPLWIWPPALALMPILAPVGEIHHYTLLLLPIAVGITSLVEGRQNKLTIGLIGLGLLLLMVPWWSLHSVVDWDGWRGLLAYPRLFGVILLWAGLLLCAST
jgi:hypothetical protein